MRAIRVHACGGPEALRYDEVEIPKPQAGEALVKIAAAGVNFIDVQHRAGRYKPPALPFTLSSPLPALTVEVPSCVTPAPERVTAVPVTFSFTASEPPAVTLALPAVAVTPAVGVKIAPPSAPTDPIASTLLS